VPYYVYILASRRNGTLYVGVTNDLMRRTGQHRDGIGSGFTRKYGVDRRVYSEELGNIAEANARETRLQKYRRAGTMNRTERANHARRGRAGKW